MAPSRCKILIVDDNRDGADSTALLLGCMGEYEIRVAYTPEQAHEVAVVFLPDVALMDVGLPGKSGYLVGRELLDLLPNLRVIALSGHASPEAMRRSIDAGFDGHLVKPVSPAVLNDEVSNACQGKGTSACS